MWIRLRQIALVARDLDQVTKDLHNVLGLEVGFRDPGVSVLHTDRVGGLCPPLADIQQRPGRPRNRLQVRMRRHHQRPRQVQRRQVIRHRPGNRIVWRP